jgi:O-antigen/teichoic acid export membrane protein
VPTSSERRLSGEEIRRRASAGVAVIGAKSIVVQGVTLAGSIVLARLLVPEDFGIVAFGTALALSLGLISGTGLAGALIRRREPPRHQELEAFLAFQLLCSLVVAGIAAVALQPFGRTGDVIALMLVSLPFAAFRVPYAVTFERGLDYRPVVTVEIVETLTYYGWAVGTVLAGWGVWGLASATIVRAAVGSSLLGFLSSLPLVRPRPAWAPMRGLLAFGARSQAFHMLSMLRTQALNAGIGFVGGLAMLGLWHLAYRVLQLPYLLFTSLWRVSFPAMSRLLANEEDPRPIIERGVALVAVATGLLLAPIFGSGPALIPSVFGERWTESAEVLPWASLGLMIGGPISVAVVGYLWALGDAATPLRALLVQGSVWLGVSLPLLPAVGLSAIGIGWLAASAAEAAVLGRRASALTGAAVFRPLLLPALGVAAAGTLGWAIADAQAPTLQTTLVAASVAEALYLGLLLVTVRPLLAEMLGLTGRAVRASIARAPSR